VGVLAQVAGAAMLKNRARLRQGPSASTALLGELDPGTKVEVLADTEGWKRVVTPDGRSGYIWGENLTEVEPETASPEGARRAEAAATPRPLADELRELRADVSALRQRPDPMTPADLQPLRAELERLASAERDLARRLDDLVLPNTAPLDPPAPAPTSAAAPLAFLAGGVVGWAASRVVQRRRDRRQRHRLRF
jgi:hypothetical protein